ncbi:succinate-semialdehyde dehydrogenase, mitochondrial [Hyalella azteca]|uniref:Succinate-semialdehyde dehydrogenase, mitochondrial n=1 Tax=Hyalella azteca TaxID=294128 RepID=A0A8B7PBT2_HYAAZ|nr:succinate-semialdehyde dehydrogenase, mitochondrial [Hyalella azteca]
MLIFTRSLFLKSSNCLEIMMNSRRAMCSLAGLHGRKLQEPWLMKNLAFINGKFVGAKSGKTFEVDNPASGKIIGEVPAMDASDTKEAIAAAHAAFATWKNTTAKERSKLLRRWFTLLEEHKEDLAIILTAEAGKPLAESRGEVAYGSSFLEFFAEEATRIHGEVLQPALPNREMLLIRQPVGVAGLITPWNFPNAMITRKAGAALAAGCTCVVKPAEDTPFSALALAALADKAGIPPGVFNVITSLKSDAAAVGNLLCTSPLVAAISFTVSWPPSPSLVSLMAAISVNGGATVLLGGAPHTAGALFYQPTLLTDVTPDMPCVATEIFGPVVAISKFETEEEALRIANDCKSGLAGYFISQDVSQVWRVARQLEVGMVGINEGLISAAEAAFGGIKESGLGREGSSHGIDDYTEIKYLCIGNTHL